MLQLVIIACVFLGVAAVVLAIGMAMRGEQATIAEDRFQVITSAVLGSGGKGVADPKLFVNFEDSQNAIERFFTENANLRKYLAQADIGLTPTRFIALTVAFFFTGLVLSPIVRIPWQFAPVTGIALALLPLIACWWMRGRRINAFGRQLPEALELMGRALRAGHSLASGICLVADEMANPIKKEFGRVYEAQNLGKPLEEALEELSERMPNLDLRFFVTAVILQRQTGGDLAEILDKIGHLVRERFKIWGQIQALTGEGRLSAVVLLGLPPGLFAMMWKMNREYALTLFTDPMGQKMLMTAVVLQLIGAWVIKKIIDIKV